MKKIIIVEPGSSAIYIVNAVKMLGYQPVILCAINQYGGEQKAYIKQYGYYEVDCSETAHIIQCIHDNTITDILGIISTADRFIAPTCQAAIALGVKGMDPALLRLNNKAEVAQLIPENSPPTVIFNRKSIPTSQLKSLLRYSGTLIFKPASSAGAKGLFELNNSEQIDHIGHLLEKEAQGNVLDKEWLAQPAVQGTLYSLEGFVLHGEIYHIGLSRRARIKYTETQNTFPIEDEVDTKIYKTLTCILEKLVRRSGYQNGYFHTEMLFDGRQAYLIDANFGRVGGGCIALQIAKATQKEIAQIYAHVLAVAFFPDQPHHQVFYPQKKIKTLALLYGIDQQAVFKEIQLNKKLSSQHIQLVDEGQLLPPVGKNNRSLIGILVGTPEEIQQDIPSISILTDIGRLRPVF